MAASTPCHCYKQINKQINNSDRSKQRNIMNTNHQNIINLVADIGGTNIRLAIADQFQQLSQISSYQCANFNSLAEVISLYLTEKELTEATLNGSVINACLAIACPVDDDLIAMTNLPWKFSQQALKQQLKLNNLTLINDYTAIALAIPHLDDTQKVKIGGGKTVAGKNIAVCGPGTGLGVASLINISTSAEKAHWHCVSGEGGHVDFAPVDNTEIEILQYLQTIKKRVSYEQLLSGYGLEQIYQALRVIKNRHEGITKENEPKTSKLSAKDISTHALSKSCDVCQQALSQFCKVLGSFAGNLALTLNSQGGVYIAGGIAPRFIDYIKTSEFRARFEAKGRLSGITQQTPTYIITESQPGLLGAAAYLWQL